MKDIEAVLEIVKAKDKLMLEERRVLLTIEEIRERHLQRWAEILPLYDYDKFKVPFSESNRLLELNKKDWMDHIADAEHTKLGSKCPCYKVAQKILDK